jgi:asparagine synthase (glutamine-hydrolysing)
VVAFAREEAPGIRCFTIETEGGQEPGMEDDLPYARRVAAHLDVPLETVRIDAVRMATDFRCMVSRLDEPLADPAVWNVFYISELARRRGIKVLLSGVGGDDLFTGYRRHTALTYQHYWNWLPEAFRSRLRRAAGTLDQRHSSSRRLAKFLSGTARSGDAQLISYFEWASEGDLRSLYTAGARAQLREQAAAPMSAFLAELPGSVPPLERLLALEQRFFVTDHNLNYTDKMSMAAGVEVRVPFLDVDLVAHAARIPPRYKQHGRTGKWVLKKAMEPYLPADVIHRAKASFGAPLRRWIRHELRADLRDALSSESLRRRGLFEPAAVQRLMAHNDSGRADAAYTLLSLMVIEFWCRRFIDGA